MFVKKSVTTVLFDLRLLGRAAFQWHWLSKYKSSREPGANPHSHPGGGPGENAARCTERVWPKQLQRKLSVQQVCDEIEEQSSCPSYVLFNTDCQELVSKRVLSDQSCVVVFFTTVHLERRPHFFCGEAQRETAHRYICWNH